MSNLKSCREMISQMEREDLLDQLDELVDSLHQYPDRGKAISTQILLWEGETFDAYYDWLRERQRVPDEDELKAHGMSVEDD